MREFGKATTISEPETDVGRHRCEEPKARGRVAWRGISNVNVAVGAHTVDK